MRSATAGSFRCCAPSATAIVVRSLSFKAGVSTTRLALWGFDASMVYTVLHTGMVQKDELGYTRLSFSATGFVPSYTYGAWVRAWPCAREFLALCKAWDTRRCNALADTHIRVAALRFHGCCYLCMNLPCFSAL